MQLIDAPIGLERLKIQIGGTMNLSMLLLVTPFQPSLPFQRGRLASDMRDLI